MEKKLLICDQYKALSPWNTLLHMKGILSEHYINQKAKPIQKHTHTKVSSYERRTVQKFMATEMKEELLRKCMK